MKSVFKGLCVGLFSLIWMGTVVLAADFGLPEPPVIEPLPQEMSHESDGWYLRGDVGGSMWFEPDVSGVSGGGAFKENEIEKSLVSGVGIGYHFSEYLRGDVTVDYHHLANYTGQEVCTTACGGLTHFPHSGSISAVSLLANAYVDIGEWYGFVPYIGGGIGVAHVNVSDYVAQSTTDEFHFPGNSAWNFAAMATAGATYHVTDKFAIDANYRFNYLGKVETGTNIRSSGKEIAFEKLMKHDLRIGGRIYLN